MTLIRVLPEALASTDPTRKQKKGNERMKIEADQLSLELAEIELDDVPSQPECQFQPKLDCSPVRECTPVLDYPVKETIEATTSEKELTAEVQSELEYHDAEDLSDFGEKSDSLVDNAEEDFYSPKLSWWKWDIMNKFRDFCFSFDWNEKDGEKMLS